MMEVKMKLAEIPIEQVDENQPRKDFQDVSDLVGSIVKSGLLEPLKVIQKAPDRYLLIDGERRYRALTKIRSTHKQFSKNVKCIILAGIKNKLIIQLVTDVHKQKLNPIEEANAFHSLISKGKVNITDIRILIGKPREYVMKRLKLLAYSEDSQKKIKSGKLSFSAASSIPIDSIKAKEKEIVSRMVDENANAEDARKIVYEVESRNQSRVEVFIREIKGWNDEIKSFGFFLRMLPEDERKLIVKNLLSISFEDIETEIEDLKTDMLKVTEDKDGKTK